MHVFIGEIGSLLWLWDLSVNAKLLMLERAALQSLIDERLFSHGVLHWYHMHLSFVRLTSTHLSLSFGLYQRTQAQIMERTGRHLSYGLQLCHNAEWTAGNTRTNLAIRRGPRLHLRQQRPPQIRQIYETLWNAPLSCNIRVASPTCSADRKIERTAYRASIHLKWRSKNAL